MIYLHDAANTRLVRALVCALCCVLPACVSRSDFENVSRGSPHDAASPPAAPLDEAGSPAEAETDGLPADAAVARTDAADDSAADDGAADDGAAEVDHVAGNALAPSVFSCAKLAAPAVFCADFEGTAPLQSWDGFGISPADGGAITVDQTAARSGVSSMLAVSQEGLAKPNPGFPSAFVFKRLSQLEGQPLRVELELDLRVEQIDPTPMRRAMLFQWRTGSDAEGVDQLALELVSRGTGVAARFLELDTRRPAPNDTSSGSAELPAAAFETPALGTWVHVTFTLDVVNPSGIGNQVKLSIDDAILFDGPLQLALREADPGFELGIALVDTRSFAAQEQTKRWQVRYDNVLVRVTALKDGDAGLPVGVTP